MLSRGSFSSLSRILFPRPLARSFTTAPVAATTSAVAFDVDGVLLRGKEALPRARAALHLLEHHNIPYVLLTNGGGTTESAKAASLSAILNHPISPASLALAHSPFRALPDALALRNKPVLVVGKRKVHQLAWDYGFRNVYDVGDLHHQWPALFPDWAPVAKKAEFDQIDTDVSDANLKNDTSAGNTGSINCGEKPRDVWEARKLSDGERIECVLTFMDPLHYHRDLQILVDVVRSGGFPGSPLSLNHALGRGVTVAEPGESCDVDLSEQLQTLLERTAAASALSQPHSRESTNSKNESNANTDTDTYSARVRSQANPDTATSKAAALPRARTPAVFISGPDLEYVTDWHTPRFGSGIFSSALSLLYKQATNTELQCHFVGKPNTLTYKYAEIVLKRMLTESQQQHGNASKRSIHGVYMVGDNPKSDICGANSNGWHSILVRSGMFTGPEGSNDREHPAKAVVNDVFDAVEYIVARESSLNKLPQHNLKIQRN